jgi:cell division protein FtsB
VWRVGLGVTVLLVAFFALQGGEYSTQELLSRTRRRAALELDVQALQRVVDSLTAEKPLVETDNATLERIAREEYGMVKGSRELLYRFADELEDERSPRQ